MSSFGISALASSLHSTWQVALLLALIAVGLAGLVLTWITAGRQALDRRVATAEFLPASTGEAER